MKAYVVLVLTASIFTSTTQVTPPPSENDIPDERPECASDSTLSEGVCKCAPERCAKPPCPTTLVVVANATTTPGRCCPVYACEGCTEDVAINGKCPCAPNATLNEAGNACECVDPHESLDEDGVCSCDLRKCELPQLCDGKSVATKELDGCCYRTKCVTCPEDSYPLTVRSDQIEPKCVCYKCKDPECSGGKKPVVVRYGKSFPGMCCDLYDCEPIENQTCVVGNKTFVEGDTWETPEGICKCQKGISLCSQSNDVVSTHRPCFTEGKVYGHQESWLEDRCTNCTCNDGVRRCIAHLCDVDESQVKRTECEPLFSCNKTCPNGYKTNKRGCEICKCAKATQLEEILWRFNVTKDELVNILNRRSEESSSSTTTPSTTIYITDKCDSQESTPWYYIVVIVLVGVLSAGIIMAVVKYMFCSRKQGKTSFPMVTPYSYSPVKAKLENNNNGRIYSSTVTEKSGAEKFRLT